MHPNLLTAGVDTPDGPFTIVVGVPAAIAPTAAVVAAGWTAEVDELLALIQPAVLSELVPGAESAGRLLDEAATAVTGYYDGDLGVPQRIRVFQRSGVFREASWRALQQIPPGRPVTYAELAARAGRPSAIRAAAGACAHNAAALFVPCHRVVRAGGQLGGFRYGLDTKRGLLEFERRRATV